MRFHACADERGGTNDHILSVGHANQEDVVELCKPDISDTGTDKDAGSEYALGPHRQVSTAVG
jgi:hypothetical protein